MSVTSENDIYEKMVGGEISENDCSLSYEKSSNFIYINCDNSNEGKMLEEEVISSEKINVKTDQEEDSDELETEKEEEFSQEASNDVPQAEFFEEQAIKYEEIKSEWIEDAEFDISKKSQIEHGKIVVSTESKMEEESQEQGGGEEEDETIATFITAAGQQLALYAVENSDEIFAVALYDESGDPPSNFQFLMKADVERLIGEGAVRTVKKPTQIKRQLVTTQTPIVIKQQPSKLNFQPKPKAHYEPKPRKTIWDYDLSKNERVNKPATKPSTHVLFSTVRKPIIANSSLEDDIKALDSFSPERTETLEYEQVDSEDEIMTTVQCLLHDEDQSDSELTFEEIQATLCNIRSNEKKKDSEIKSPVTQEPANGLTYSNKAPQKQSTKSNLIPQIFRKQPANREVVEKSYEPIPLFQDDAIDDHFPISEEEAGKENTAIPLSPEKKEKRPRKQKLTSMNRGDSEIIIQPASQISEEEEMPTKKRGRRKRKILPDPDYNPRTPVRKIKNMRRVSRVEVIEIDVDEDDETEVVDITLDDGKEKSSSDKENNVIEVGDSDDEDDDENSSEKLDSSLLTCEFCSRNCRQKSALEAHMRICSKSPANAQRLKKKTQKSSSSDSSIKREYSCKTCSEKFDAALTLARHVRANHSQKRGRPRKRPLTPDEETSLSEEEEEEEEENFSEDEDQRKDSSSDKTGKGSPNSKDKDKKTKQFWKLEKTRRCEYCAKRFPDIKSLVIHVRLQHTTKKIDNARSCKICKKVLKNSALLRRHMRVHRDTMDMDATEENEAENVPCVADEPETSPVVVRKRGRPRKIKLDA